MGSDRATGYDSFKTILVVDITGQFAVAGDDGQRLYDRMYEILGTAQNVQVDFYGVRVIATPFFNAAVGRLLKDVSPDELRNRISFKNLSLAAERTLAKVIENAKQYYHDPEARAALDKILIEHGDES